MVFSLAAVLDLAALIATAVSIFIVYTRNPRGAANDAYAFFAACVMGFIASEFFLYVAPDAVAAGYWLAPLFTFSSLLPFSFLVFLRHLQGKRWASYKTGAALTFSVVVALLSWNNQLASGVKVASEGFIYAPGRLFGVYGLGMVLFFLLALLGFWVFYLDCGEFRLLRQLRLFALATSVLLFVGVTANLIFPLLGITVPRLASVSAALFALLASALASSLEDYRLFRAYRKN